MISLSKISLSSHVLDTTLGKPAADMVLILTTPDGKQHQGKTDADGRCRDWGYLNTQPAFIACALCVRTIWIVILKTACIPLWIFILK